MEYGTTEFNFSLFFNKKSEIKFHITWCQAVGVCTCFFYKKLYGGTITAAATTTTTTTTTTAAAGATTAITTITTSHTSFQYSISNAPQYSWCV